MNKILATQNNAGHGAEEALWLSRCGEVILFQSDSHCLCPPPPFLVVTLEPYRVPGYRDPLSEAPRCFLTARTLRDL